MRITRCRRDDIIPLLAPCELDARHAPNDALWWRAHDSCDTYAFAGLAPYYRPHCAFLCLSGVHPASRGRGLQRRLIRVRERYARRHGFPRAVTYTSSDNVHSANNLIECGYRLYEPPYYWGLRHGLYFQKGL